MSTKFYNRLRYSTQILLPAIATFLMTLAGAWNLDYCVKISTTISAIVTLLSGVLGVSSAIYDKEGGNYDGECSDGDIADYLHKFVHISNMACSECEQEEE